MDFHLSPPALLTYHQRDKEKDGQQEKDNEQQCIQGEKVTYDRDFLVVGVLLLEFLPKLLPVERNASEIGKKAPKSKKKEKTKTWKIT